MGSQPQLIEILEERRLLSASIFVKDGTLFIQGTPRADHIIVSKHGPGGGTPDLGFSPLYVTLNDRTRLLKAAGIHRVRVDAGAGDDHVEMTDDPFFTGTRIALIIIEQTLPATILGGAGNDTLIGGTAADSISGGAGCDLIGGGGGNDTLDGDGNSDTLAGHAGKDLLRGGNGDDRFATDDDDRAIGGQGTDFFSQTGNTFTTDASLRFPTMEGLIDDAALGAPDMRIDGDTLVIFGTRRSDSITVENSFLPRNFLSVFVGERSVSSIPSEGINRIRIDGGDGDDSIQIGPETRVNMAFIPEFVPITQSLELIGGNGNDTLIGGDGKDALSGGAGDDVLAGGDNDDSLDGGVGNDTLRGNNGADTLRGRKGEDSLDGGDGNDTVVGGEGTDAVVGGAGVDYFQYPTDQGTEIKDQDSNDVTTPAPGYNF